MLIVGSTSDGNNSPQNVEKLCGWEPCSPEHHHLPKTFMGSTLAPGLTKSGCTFDLLGQIYKNKTKQIPISRKRMVFWEKKKKNLRLWSHRGMGLNTSSITIMWFGDKYSYVKWVKLQISDLLWRINDRISPKCLTASWHTMCSQKTRSYYCYNLHIHIMISQVL